MKIFISYRRVEDDKTYIIGNLHKPLTDAFGADAVFLDREDIRGGDKWRSVLQDALNSCQVMLVVIGPDWTNLTLPNGVKRLDDPGDVTRWEVETGLKRSEEKKTTVIPVLVMKAGIPKAEELPEILRPLLDRNVIHIRNYPDFTTDIEKLISDVRRSLGYAADDIKIDEAFEPRTVYVAEGSFLMGSLPGEGISKDESPQHEVRLPAYRIGITPVTNAQYQVFVQETGTRALPILDWMGQRPRDDRLDHPVAGVTFQEARAYCEWLSRKSNREYIIPNEAQWEKACRAGVSSRYPWGEEFIADRSNHGKSTLASVTSYPAQNEFGLRDLVGNVRQWTCSLWGESRVKPDEKFGYPWMNDRRNDVGASSQILRVVRGYSFAEDALTMRSTSRKGQLPGDAGWIGAGMGFRVAMKV